MFSPRVCDHKGLEHDNWHDRAESYPQPVIILNHMLYYHIVVGSAVGCRLAGQPKLQYTRFFRVYSVAVIPKP